MGNVEAGARAGELPDQSVPSRFDYAQLSPQDARLFGKGDGTGTVEVISGDALLTMPNPQH